MTVMLGAMSGAAAAAALAGRPVILLPLGSHESHGPGLPMGDYRAAEAVAVAIAERAEAAGDACVVAPVLPFGGADFFGSVPGAIALGEATLRAVLTDMLACLLRHGLDRLLIVNGHGGNAGAIHAVTLAVRHAHGVIVPSLPIWQAARVLMGADAAGRAGHGADPVASIAMHLFGVARPVGGPARSGALFGLPVGGFAHGVFEGIPVDLPVEYDDIAPDGVAPGGDPARADAADGARLTARLVEIGAALVAHVAHQRGEVWGAER